jgi:hypothetical protein
MIFLKIPNSQNATTDWEKTKRITSNFSSLQTGYHKFPASSPGVATKAAAPSARAHRHSEEVKPRLLPPPWNPHPRRRSRSGFMLGFFASKRGRCPRPHHTNLAAEEQWIRRRWRVSPLLTPCCVGRATAAPIRGMDFTLYSLDLVQSFALFTCVFGHLVVGIDRCRPWRRHVLALLRRLGPSVVGGVPGPLIARCAARIRSNMLFRPGRIVVVDRGSNG